MRRPLHTAAIALLLAAVSAAGNLFAVRAPERARTGAVEWVRLHAPGGRRGARAAYVRERMAGGRRYQEIALEGGGAVIAPEDESLPPVLAYLPSGRLPEKAEGPLWALLAGVKGGGGAAWSGRAALKGSGSAPAPLETLDRPRVAPLVTSRWGQGTVWEWDPVQWNFVEQPVYNYYTPENFFCGCTATAMAQLMRYHRHPAQAVASATYPCEVCPRGGSRYATRNLPLLGGVYAWNLMPDAPGGDYAAVPEAQRQAIGRLTYDCAVAMRTQFDEYGGSAAAGFAYLPLKEDFLFANAVGVSAYGSFDVAAHVEGIVLANLDARCPVLLGVEGEQDGYAVGHSVLADGYGICGGVAYTHLNMGWEGQYDVWYALPAIDNDFQSFGAVSSAVFNVFPSVAGEILSGRVLDGEGIPLRGAVVSAHRHNTVEAVASGVTDGNGIYALTLPGNVNYTLVAAYGRVAVTNASEVYLGVSRGIRSPNFSTLSYLLPPGGMNCGNSWGNDITVPFRGMVLRVR